MISTLSTRFLNDLMITTDCAQRDFLSMFAIPDLSEILGSLGILGISEFRFPHYSDTTDARNRNAENNDRNTDSDRHANAKRSIRAELRKTWQREYSDAVQGSTTRLFFPTIDSIAFFRESISESSFQVTQVLTGHGFHAEYLTRFRIKADSRCPCDRESVQDISHLLLTCPHFAGLRRGYVGLCADMGVAPLDLASASKYPSLIESFITFSTNLIDSLKEFNSNLLN